MQQILVCMCCYKRVHVHCTCGLMIFNLAYQRCERSGQSDEAQFGPLLGISACALTRTIFHVAIPLTLAVAVWMQVRVSMVRANMGEGTSRHGQGTFKHRCVCTL